jgi:hypothetical protein
MKLAKICLAAAILGTSLTSMATSFTVTSGGDAAILSGNTPCTSAAASCTLRAAIEEGNRHSGPHTITFSPTVVMVTLATQLQTMTAPFIITGNPVTRTILNGNHYWCLQFTDAASVLNPAGANGSTVANMVIQNCNSDGISANGHGYVFTNNYIGTDITGASAAPNTGHGISISASHVYPDTSSNFLLNLYNSFPIQPIDSSNITTFSSNLVTALATLTQPVMITNNVISGNTINGIEIYSQNLAAVIVSGNRIGTDTAGNSAIPNGSNGIRLIGSTFGNLIGPDNVISGNTANGIDIEAGTVFLPNFIMGNRIGLGMQASADIGNGASGIFVNTKPDSSPTNFNPSMLAAMIGPGNVISDNKGVNNNGFLDDVNGTNAGIIITGQSSKVKVIGNTIGMGEFPKGTASQSMSYGNAGDGIIITTGGNTIGGSASTDANIITGNARHGIVVKLGSTTGNQILGNYIGVHPSFGGNLTLGNGGDGIHSDNAASSTIGGIGATDRNIIAGNGRNGIALRGGGNTSGWANLFQRNQIYSNAKKVAGIGIDLDHTANAADDPTHTEYPANYANGDQTAPVICTGPGNSGACSGSTAPAGTASATTVSWTLATHGPATFRVEFFSVNAASVNAATNMVFLGEQTVTTDAASVLTGAGCSNGRCTTGIGVDTRGAGIVMTVTDVTQILATPGAGWMSMLQCFLLSPCNVNNTSEFSNVAMIALPSNSPPVFAFVPAQNATFGAAVNLGLSPYVSKTDGDAILGYAIAGGALPNGLLLNAASGVISGTPTAAGSFSASITASDKDGASNAATVQFTVAKGVQTITFGVAPTLVYGGAAANASASATSGLPVTLVSNTPAVCTVAGMGVTPVTAGICILAADQPGDSNYAPAVQATQMFNIAKAKQTITFGAAPIMKVGGAAGTVTATSTSGLPVTFSSNTTAVCLVSGNAATAVASGSCTIAADQFGDTNYSAATQVTQTFNIAQNAVRHALFVNASSSANKTSLLRIINLDTQAGAVTATAYDEAGNLVGNGGASLGPIAPQQMLTFTSPQLEAAIGYTPSSSTAKYRIVLSTGLPSFEVINFIKDVATGNLTLGQAQTADRAATAALTSTRNALFVNPSTSLNKTSVVRLINLGSQSGAVTALAYNESGNQVGISSLGAAMGTLGPRQMMTFTSAQIETLIGYKPSAPTAKYRIVFTANLPSFEVINFVKDIATGNLTLGQSQIDNRAASASSTSTRNALFVSASSSATKTSVIRLINLNNQSGAVTATAYTEAGSAVGAANATMGTLFPNQILTFTSAQLEAAIGYVPSSTTAKYRIVFNATLPSFEVINFIKDNASGNLTLGQAQIDDRGISIVSNSTRNALFINASSSSNKTSVLRVINLGGQGGNLSASAYDEAGNPVGAGNAPLGAIAARQMLTFTSAQLEAAIGYAPGSGSAKYRVVLSANLPSFEVINFIKDVATGNLILGQEQID